MASCTGHWFLSLLIVLGCQSLTAARLRPIQCLRLLLSLLVLSLGICSVPCLLLIWLHVYQVIVSVLKWWVLTRIRTVTVVLALFLHVTLCSSVLQNVAHQCRLLLLFGHLLWITIFINLLWHSIIVDHHHFIDTVLVLRCTINISLVLFLTRW